MQRQMADATPDLCRECGDEATVTLMGARFCLAHAQAIEEDFNRPGHRRHAGDGGRFEDVGITGRTPPTERGTR